MMEDGKIQCKFEKKKKVRRINVGGDDGLEKQVSELVEKEKEEDGDGIKGGESVQ